MSNQTIMQEDYQVEIDLLELFQVLLDNLWLIIGMAVLGFVLAFSYTRFFIEPTYESVSTVFIQPTVKDNQVVSTDLTTNQKLTATYTEIAKSNTVIKQVAPLFVNYFEADEIKNLISVAGVGDTQIIRFSAVTTDAHLSQRLVSKLVSVFVSEIKDIMEIDNLTIIDVASLNEDKVAPSTTLNSAIGLVLGLMIGVGIAFLKMMLNRSIKNRAEAERLLALPVLGEIYLNE